MAESSAPSAAFFGIFGMFGISTALIVALMTRLIEQRMKVKDPEMDAMSEPSGDRK